MKKTFKLKRTVQCALCPWRMSTDPNTIPNGYSPEKHENLKRTVASSGALEQVLEHLNKKPLRVMACHENHEAHCIGWLHHQLGDGNNIRLRIDMMNCENLEELEIVGPQHATFEDTLPENK